MKDFVDHFLGLQTSQMQMPTEASGGSRQHMGACTAPSTGSSHSLVLAEDSPRAPGASDFSGEAQKMGFYVGT